MDPWFLFDAALVANMVVETWLVPIIIVAAGTDAADVLNISFLRMMRALAENSLPGRGMNRIAVCTKEQYEIRIMKMHEVSNGVQRVKRCPTVSVIVQCHERYGETAAAVKNIEAGPCRHLPD